MQNASFFRMFLSHFYDIIHVFIVVVAGVYFLFRNFNTSPRIVKWSIVSLLLLLSSYLMGAFAATWLDFYPRNLDLETHFGVSAIFTLISGLKIFFELIGWVCIVCLLNRISKTSE